MNLTLLSWNVKRASEKSDCWDLLSNIDPDIAFLQEVISIPSRIKSEYSILLHKATNKKGSKQKFGTAILSKFPICTDLKFQSKYNWVNKELDIFSGNLINCTVCINKNKTLNLVSVYSPPWKIDPKRFDDFDINLIKLENNPDLWLTEILWSILKQSMHKNADNWIVAGDYNASVTFDYMWGSKPRGNQEFIDRMNKLGLIESVFYSNKEHIPTYKNTNGGKVIHQMDHMFLSENLIGQLESSGVEKDLGIFENSISDHLPIFTKLNIEN